ncbi:MAG: tetratricopeptide repeat protein [Candidatus Eisenbacteria bacterium]|nr:tetratricopeptide repeat protein [Candidatus Eisenbacteria bacterium]
MGTRTRITRKSLKHDALLETTAKGTKFIEQHLNKVLVAVAVLAVVAVVAIMVMRGQRTTELAANAELVSASQTAGAGLLAQASQQYQAIIDTYPGTRSAGAATCYLGTIHFQQGDYDQALQRFQDYLDHFGKSGNLGRVALEGQASVLEQRRDFAAAADIYRQLADQAKGQNTTVARYLSDAMRCYRSASDWASVRTTATQIVDGYQGTPSETDARTMLAEADAHLGM